MINLTITNDIEYEFAIKVLEAFALEGHSNPITDLIAHYIDEYERRNDDIRALEGIVNSQVFS